MIYRWSLVLTVLVSSFFSEPVRLLGAPGDESEVGILMSKRGYTSVSFSRSSTGHPLIHASINGAPVLLIVDTGSPTTVLDKERSARFGVVPMGRNLNAASLGSTRVSSDVAELKEFRIGALTLHRYSTAIMDLSVVNAGVDPRESVDGIVGADVLTRCKAVLDYGTSTLYLFAPK